MLTLLTLGIATVMPHAGRPGPNFKALKTPGSDEQ
jgi:hypothetical protein